MAWEKALELISATASEDLSDAQYKFVTLTGTSMALSSAGEEGFVLQNKTPDTVVGDVGISGITRLIAGEAIGAGAEVAAGAGGKGVVATGGAVIRGKAMTAAAADGDEISMLIQNAKVIKT